MKAILSDLARPRLLAVVTVTAIIGILGGLLPMLPLGNLRPDGFNAEIVYRFNDFENYGWHRAEKTDASIHPVYATAIAANKTLPVGLMGLRQTMQYNSNWAAMFAAISSCATSIMSA